VAATTIPFDTGRAWWSPSCARVDWTRRPGRAFPSDPDHLNGLHACSCSRFEVGTLWTSGDDGHNPKYRRNYWLWRNQRGVATPVPAGYEKQGHAGRDRSDRGWGDVVGPPPGLDANNASLVCARAMPDMRCCSQETSASTVKPSWWRGEKHGLVVASDVVKVPHHGSRTSSGDEFLAAVQPNIAVVSVGKTQHFHLPSSATLSRYAARGVARATHGSRWRGHGGCRRPRPLVGDLRAQAAR